MSITSFFHAYPSLAKSLPHIELADLPTPIELFTFKDQSEPPMPNLWVKRDDQSSALYGGNKVRKLEFVLAELQAQGKTSLLTFGATGTNHGVATSIFCQQLGIQCKILLFNQPSNKAVEDNYALMQHFGAQLEYKHSLTRVVTHFYFQKLLNNKDTYYLFAGGSNIAGCISFVSAAFELKQQIEQGLLPEPEVIFCPVGSTSTVAGLTLGCALAGLKSRVIGVRVTAAYLGVFPACTTGTIKSLMGKTLTYLCDLDSSVPKINLPVVHLEDGFFGSGYGHASEVGGQATEVFGRAGIKLEPTYTAKAAAAVLQHCAANPRQSVLYWHTYNSVDMSDYLPEETNHGG